MDEENANPPTGADGAPGVNGADGAGTEYAPPHTPTWLAFAMLASTALFWGGTTVAARAAAGDIPPLTLTFWRWAIAFVIFLPFGIRPWWRQRTLYLRHWKMMTGLSFLGIVGFTAWGHTSFALGVGRHALDELATIAKAKAGPFGILADSPSFKEKYARAEAKYRSVRALIYSAWNDIDETLEREEPASLEQIALLKLGFRYAHEVMSEICTFAYHGGGGVALRSSPLQRCYRDLHAGLQHVLLSDQIMQDCGTVLMGHARNGAKWELLGLKQPDE